MIRKVPRQKTKLIGKYVGSLIEHLQSVCNDSLGDAVQLWCGTPVGDKMKESFTGSGIEVMEA